MTLARGCHWGYVSIAALLLTLSLASCGGDGGAEGEGGEIKVLTTLPLFADFVRQIGGDRVEVTSLVPTGADPHTWEPSPDDVKRIREADVAFANGLALDDAAADVIEANIRQGEDFRPPTRFWKLADDVSLAMEVEGIPRQGDNPHLWLDVRIADLYLSMIRDVLNGHVTGPGPFEERYDRYFQELTDADSYVRDMIATVPVEGRKLVTAHDAFAYFAAAYDLQVLEVVAESPGQEPSPEDIAEIARAIEREGIPAVFVEPQAEEESRILEQAAEDAGVQVCTLYSDSLDDRVTTYTELMRFNADELVRCLG